MATRGEHAKAIAIACGNLNPSQDVINFLVGWSMFETGGTPRPVNNMLACGEKEPGSTNFNSIVQNYLTIGDEASAVATNLSENFAGYSDLKKAIATGNLVNYTTGLHTWTGNQNGYDGSEFISTGASHINDDYDTGSSSGSGTVTNNSSNPLDVIANFIVSLTAPTIYATNVLKALSDIANDPIRLVKFIAGFLSIAIGLLMVLVDVFEIVSNSQPVKAIKKTSATVSKVAEMAA